MKKIISWGILSLSVMLITSCGGLTTNQIDFVAKADESQSQAQRLPINARVNIAGKVIELEVAQTPEEQSKGLMFREELPDNRGMFFPFTYPRITRFWMKNCLVPLDMIFLQDGKVVAIADSVPPCDTAPEDCPVYGPNVLVDGVIELRSGRAKELNLDMGDNLNIEFLDISQQN